MVTRLRRCGGKVVAAMLWRGDVVVVTRWRREGGEVEEWWWRGVGVVVAWRLLGRRTSACLLWGEVSVTMVFAEGIRKVDVRRWRI